MPSTIPNITHRLERKFKPGKISVEVYKEGTVSYMAGDALDGSANWEKCKLILGILNNNSTKSD